MPFATCVLAAATICLCIANLLRFRASGFIVDAFAGASVTRSLKRYEGKEKRKVEGSSEAKFDGVAAPDKQQDYQ